MKELQLGPENPVDWSKSLKNIKTNTIDEYLRLLEKIGRSKVKNQDDSIELLDYFPGLADKSAAIFIITLANLSELPENISVLLVNNDTGLLPYIIKQYRPKAKFTFYSSAVDLHAFQSYIFPDSDIVGPDDLIDLAKNENAKFDLIIYLEMHCFYLQAVGEPDRQRTAKSPKSSNLLKSLPKLLNQYGKLITNISDVSDEWTKVNWLEDWYEFTKLSIVAIIEDVPFNQNFIPQVMNRLIIASKPTQSEIFSVKYDNCNELQVVIARHFLHKQLSKKIVTGYWTNIKNYQSVEKHKHLIRLHRLANKANLSVRIFRDVILKIRDANTDIKSENRLYLNKYFEQIQTDKFSISRNLKSTDNPKNWLVIDINPDLAISDYIVGFFTKSPLGKDVEQYLHDKRTQYTHSTYLTLNSVINCPIYIPDLKTQNEVIKAEDWLTNIEGEVSNNSYLLWKQPTQVNKIKGKITNINKKDTLVNWLDLLPFPLAMTIWIYNSKCKTNHEKTRKLLHFFEATAILLATIHLSALRSKPELINRVFPISGIKLEKVTFGKWVRILNSLSTFSRNLLANGSDDDKKSILDAYGVNDKRNIESLSSKSIIDSLYKATRIRNEGEAHGGEINDTKAKETHEELRSLIQGTTKNMITEIWRCYDLILPINGEMIDDGDHKYNVRMAIGARVPLVIETINTKKVLRSNQLHLFCRYTGKTLELLPLIKILTDRENSDDICLFYNGKEDSGEIRYISYHSGQVPDDAPKKDPDIEKLFKLFRV